MAVIAPPLPLPFDLGGLGTNIVVTPNTYSAFNQITVNGLTGFDRITISRNNPDGTNVVLRSANGATITGDTFSTFDVEAPLGASVTYTAYVYLFASPEFNATLVSAPVTISATSSTAWIKNVANSATSVQVNVVDITDVTRPQRVLGNYPVLERRYPIIINDVRQGRTGKIQVATYSVDDAEALQLLFDDGSVLFFQTSSLNNFPDMYFAAGDLIEQRPGISTDITWIYEFTFTEQSSPSGALTTVSGNSYLQVVNFGTYQKVIDNRTTYLDVLNRPFGS